MTDTMTAHPTPTVPGTSPGLVRLGSPLIYRTPGGQSHRCVALAVDGDLVTVAVYDPAPWPRGFVVPMGVRLSHVDLDLSDATGRAHGTWWLADATDVEPPRVLPDPDHVILPADTRRYSRLSGDWSAWSYLTSDLDSADPALLPDGSRWVNAETLRRMLVHAAGLEMGT